METLFNLLISIIIGGMVTFQVLFAPLIFVKLETKIARTFIRQFFPFYYIYFGALTLASLVVAVYLNRSADTIVLAASLLGSIISRQYLMPEANTASDTGNKSRFDLLHRLTVLINTLQLGAIGYLMVFTW
jgi:hypothetical protein